jgi:uncharacterized membrane protein YqjE
MAHTTCAIPDNIVEAFKTFKARRNAANCAIILSINKNDLTVEIEETLEVLFCLLSFLVLVLVIVLIAVLVLVTVTVLVMFLFDEYVNRV